MNNLNDIRMTSLSDKLNEKVEKPKKKEKSVKKTKKVTKSKKK